MSLVVSCIDCGAPSVTSLCDVCFNRRIPCKNTNCTTRLNPNLPYALCKRCTCIEPMCFNIRYATKSRTYSKCKTHMRCKKKGCILLVGDETQSYCNGCIHTWNKKCVRCPTRQAANISECEKLLCKSCFDALPLCLSCQRSRIKVDASGKSYNYCSWCLCNTLQCPNQRLSPTIMYCRPCYDNVAVCNKMGKHGPCPWAKLSAKHKQCNTCCWADKCTNRRQRNSNFCKECSKQYAQNGAEICAGIDCFRYTANASESLCSECASPQTLVVAK